MRQTKKLLIPVEADCLDKVFDFLEWEITNNKGNEADDSFQIDKDDVDKLLQLSIALKIPSLQKFCEKGEKEKVEARVIQWIQWEEVLKHSTLDSCWIVIDSCVYDVTKWIDHHPGGRSILNGVGGDCANYFEIYHHSTVSLKMLNKYFIGVLSDEDKKKVKQCKPDSNSMKDEELGLSVDFLQNLRTLRGHP